MSAVATRLELLERDVAGSDSRVPVVAVHGARTSAGHLLGVLDPIAEALHRRLVAPAFDCPAHRGFQRLALPGDPLGAAKALERSLDERSEARIDLLGVSGGAQFAHRFALLHPSRVRRMVLVGAGWYTELDADRPFPQGVGGVPADVPGFLEIPTLLLVGERDVGRSALLRSGSDLDERQGAHRLARAVWWRQHVVDHGVRLGVSTDIRLELLRNVGHAIGPAVTSGQLHRALAAFLAGADG